ncbi:MAG: hypothetical protein Kilf2KO_22190 [Rhodospirillales bacterium]
MTAALKTLDRAIAWLSDLAATLLLVLLVIVVLYNVVLRYLFEDPPFWTDRVGTSANMAMVLIGLSLAVRHRDLIAMQALYDRLPPRAALILDAIWNAAILAFSLLFVWYGAIAANNMPGMYWDFQAFCIDVDLGPPQSGFLISTVKLFEDVVAFVISPLCVDGAVPQRYMAMLMPLSGFLLVIASLGVIVADLKEIARWKR